MGAPAPRAVGVERLKPVRAGKLSSVNTVEVLLVLAGIPLAIIAVLALLTLRGGRKRLRYKPGQPWDHAPVWYEPHPANGASDSHGPAPAAGPAAVGGSSTAALGSSMYPEQAGERDVDTHGTAVAHLGSAGAHGGDGHGGGAHASGAGSGYPPVDAGPLGGARGTW